MIVLNVWEKPILCYFLLRMSFRSNNTFQLQMLWKVSSLENHNWRMFQKAFTPCFIDSCWTINRTYIITTLACIWCNTLCWKWQDILPFNSCISKIDPLSAPPKLYGKNCVWSKLQENKLVFSILGNLKKKILCSNWIWQWKNCLKHQLRWLCWSLVLCFQN